MLTALSPLRGVLTTPEALHGSRRLVHRVCVVGAGPAGFYVTQGILKSCKTPVRIDILEKLPFPFGLVRYGVAPDHPEVKNVTNTFTNTLKRPEVEFFGNVEVGVRVCVAELRENYDAVVLSHGCNKVRKLGVPGEDLPNVISAKDFVGWYNGDPECTDLSVDLTRSDTAVVVGVGNVALDVARILLMPVDAIARTDITPYALESLRGSKIRRVHIVGRRGPLQAAFTIKELRELIKLPQTRPVIRPGDVDGLAPLLASLPRPRRRIVQLMIDTAKNNFAGDSRTEWFLRFFLNPKQFIGSSSGVDAVEFNLNVPDTDVANNSAANVAPKGGAVAVTDKVETIDAQLAFVSIGYLAEPLDPALPFDKKLGVYENAAGRVTGTPGVYCCGWVQSGPVGVILTTMSNGFAIAEGIAADLESGSISTPLPKPGGDWLKEKLASSGAQIVSKEDWLKLESIEDSRGTDRGVPRIKITSVQEALSLLK